MDWPHFLAKYCAPLWVSHFGEEPSLRTGKIKMDEKTYLGDQSKNVGFGAGKLTTCCHKNKRSLQSAMVPMSCGTILMRPFCWLVGMDLICLLDFMLATAMAVGFPPLGLGVVRGFLRNPKTGSRNAGTQEPWTLLLGCKVGLLIECVCGPFFYTEK